MRRRWRILIGHGRYRFDRNHRHHLDDIDHQYDFDNEHDLYDFDHVDDFGNDGNAPAEHHFLL